jgi:hypothetical protein
MLKDRESLLVIATTLVIGLLWWHEYVRPKQATLDAAAECMFEQGETLQDTPQTRVVWKACLQEAEAQHATKTLLAFGY